MKDDLIKYFEDCTNTLPVNGIIGQSVVLCLLAVVVLIIFGKRKGWKWSAAFLPVEYLVWIVFLVLIFRTTMPERTAILTPFWSHDPSLEGYGHLHPQVIMNVLVFIPIGALLGCAFDKMKWWKAVLLGASFSILIEVLQFATKRGYAEFDDLFHNTLGCLIGFGLFAGFAAAARRLSRRRGEG